MIGEIARLSSNVRGRISTFRRVSLRTFFATPGLFDGSIADRCDRHVQVSPFGDIKSGPYDPLPEFVMGSWKGANGDLKDEIAIVDGSTGMQRTYRDFYNDSCGIAASLKYDLGIDENACVCLFAPNHVDYLPVTLAVGMCGAKVTPVNPLYKAEELQLILERSQTSVLIAHVDVLDIALEAAKTSKSVKHVVVMTENGQRSPVADVETLDSIKTHARAFSKTLREVHPETDQHPYLLPYSSGTTGLPKGVCLTHSNIVSNLLQFERIEASSFPPGEKLISPLPFFHIYGMTVSSIYCAWKGNPVITMSGRFDLETFLQLVEEHKPSRSHLVPPIILALAKHPMVDNYDLSSLKCIISGAAPLGLEVEAAAKERLGCVVKQAWGMSELSPVGTCNSDELSKPSSIGPMVPSSQGKIIDDQGNSLPPNKSGELCIKGPQVMMGYLNDPEKTAECLSESGWLRTGDVAYYDEDGYFYITDRIKELIKVRGYQVAPAELEALLLSNDLVNDAAVIQIPDKENGELPRAYIVLKDNSLAGEDTKSEIYEWVKERVAPYKRLDGGIVFKDAVPKSASGKILRRLLRDELAQDTS